MIAENEDLLVRRIHLLLRRLCIGGNLRGFYYLAYAIEATVHDPFRVQLITKDLYPTIARRFGVSPSSVERSIRTAISVCWKRGGKEALNQMLVRHLIERPSSAEFIDMLADYIRHLK